MKGLPQMLAEHTLALARHGRDTTIQGLHRPARTLLPLPPQTAAGEPRAGAFPPEIAAAAVSGGVAPCDSQGPWHAHVLSSVLLKARHQIRRQHCRTGPTPQHLCQEGATLESEGAAGREHGEAADKSPRATHVPTLSQH